MMLNRLATCPAKPLMVITALLTLVERAEIKVFRNGVVVPKEESAVPLTLFATCENAVDDMRDLGARVSKVVLSDDTSTCIYTLLLVLKS